MDKVTTAATEVSVLVPEIWSRNFYDVLLAQLPFNDLIAKDWEGEIQNLGDTVRISQVPEFGPADELAEDAAGESDSVTVTQQSLVINKRVYKDIIVTNLSLLQSIPFMDKLQELANYAIMKKVQSNIIAAIVPSAAAPDHQLAYGVGTTLALSDLLEVKEALDTQDVPPEGRSAVWGAAQLNDIFNITGFTSSDFLISGAPLQTGQLPDALLGFRPRFTTEVGNTSYYFHSLFFTMATQQGLNINRYDLGVQGKRAQRINIDLLYGQKQLDNLRVVTKS